LLFFFSFSAQMISTITLLALVANAQGGIFDTLFGVVKTVVNNDGKIQVGDIVKNIAMTNMVNLPNIPGVDIGGLLNGVGGLVGMKIFGGGSTSAPTMPPMNPTGGGDPSGDGDQSGDGDSGGDSSGGDSSGGDSSGGDSSGGDSTGGSTGDQSGGGNWFTNLFKPSNNNNNNNDPSNGWLNIFGGGGNQGGMNDPNMNDPMNDPSGGMSDPNMNDDPSMDSDGGGGSQMSTKVGVGSPCRGVTGTCLDSSVSTCSPAFLTGKCPGPTEVRCCPSGGVAGMVMSGDNQDPDQPVSSGGGSCSSYGGLVFPLASGSLDQISSNWGGSRQGGIRCHAGLDILTTGPRRIVAMSDGEVVSIMKNWYQCKGNNIDAIFVYHSSGALQGKTINYGEVDPGSYSVQVGSPVRRGQSLGTGRGCGMLHFELYAGRQTQNSHWKPASGQVGPGCASNSMHTKPSVLLDPRPVIRCTLPSGARFKNGAGLLNSGDVSVLNDELDEIDNGDQFDAGAIVGIVIAVLVVIALVVGVVIFVRMRRANRGADQGVSVPNAAYSTGPAPADLGHFKCEQCGKEYNYANDLQVHMNTRHTAA
jgi:hypothetical protein